MDVTQEKLLFENTPTIATISATIDEISGIADSKLNKGYLICHEDSYNPAKIYLIKHDGSSHKSIHLAGITNRDWEEIQLSGSDVYLAETGDNGQTYSSYRYYKFTEPIISADTVKNIETINFTYPDGSHDSEAFIVDPLTKDIYIFTKRDNPSKIYKLSFPYSTNNQVELAGSFPYTGIVGAAVSNDGTELITKTYSNLYYYKRIAGQSIADALKNSFKSLPYTKEPKGEAVCFASDNGGYFTVSEKVSSSPVNIFFYRRK